MTDGEFNDELDGRFLAEVAKYPFIYDRKDKDYKNNVKRDKAWTDIAAKVKKRTDLCRKRWKAIRDIYNKRRKALTTRTGSSKARQRNPNPVLQHMGFMDALGVERVTSSNNTVTQETGILARSQEEIAESHQYSGYEIKYIQGYPDHPGLSHIGEGSETTGTNDSTEPRTVAPGIPNFGSNAIPNFGTTSLGPASGASKKKKSKTKSEESDRIFAEWKKFIQERDSSLYPIGAGLIPPPPTKAEDDIDIFFKSIAATVKTFPPVAKAEIKAVIFEKVSSMEMKVLQSSSSHATSSPASQSIFPSTYSQSSVEEGNQYVGGSSHEEQGGGGDGQSLQSSVAWHDQKKRGSWAGGGGC